MEAPSKPNVGVIGLGAMGLGVARSLLRAGLRAHGCDVRPDVLAAFAAEGGIACATPAELARHCPVVIVLVVNISAIASSSSWIRASLGSSDMVLASQHVEEGAGFAAPPDPGTLGA